MGRPPLRARDIFSRDRPLPSGRPPVSQIEDLKKARPRDRSFCISLCSLARRGFSRRAVTATSSSENATLLVIAFLLRIKHARSWHFADLDRCLT
jgi:hypothetical protein